MRYKIEGKSIELEMLAEVPMITQESTSISRILQMPEGLHVSFTAYARKSMKVTKEKQSDVTWIVVNDNSWPNFSLYSNAWGRVCPGCERQVTAQTRTQ